MRYLSQCPNCDTVYQLSIAEMNISNGMVKCSVCTHVFDAFTTFIIDPEHEEEPVTNYLTEVLLPQLKITSSVQVHESESEEIIHNKLLVDRVESLLRQNVEGSRLDLYTYLNYLDILNPVHHTIKSEIQAQPYNVHLTDHDQIHTLKIDQKTIQQRKKYFFYRLDDYSQIRHMWLWRCISCLIVITIIVQIFIYK